MISNENSDNETRIKAVDRVPSRITMMEVINAVPQIPVSYIKSVVYY